MKIETELVCVTTTLKILEILLLGKFPGGLYFTCDKLVQMTNHTEGSRWKRIELRVTVFQAQEGNT